MKNRSKPVKQTPTAKLWNNILQNRKSRTLVNDYWKTDKEKVPVIVKKLLDEKKK